MLPADPYRHQFLSVNGVRLHLARAGRIGAPPLLLLHGWPEFWLTWAPVIDRLADRFDLIVPDLRGFGASDKPPALTVDPRGGAAADPADAADANQHAADLAALIEHLGLGRVGIASHDVGAYAAQALARLAPERVTGLFFFDCPYPGIGARWAEAGHLIETWYQYFNQMPFAAELIGGSRESCRLFIGHFLRHWAGRPDAFDDVLERWVDNFMAPGALQGGFNWYVGSAAARRAVISGMARPMPPIPHPTCVRWGDQDPVLPVAWADRLAEHFSDLDFAPFTGAGHFPHREMPDRAAAEIAGFFERVQARAVDAR